MKLINYLNYFTHYPEIDTAEFSVLDRPTLQLLRGGKDDGLDYLRRRIKRNREKERQRAILAQRKVTRLRPK